MNFASNMGPSVPSKRTFPKDVACCLILLSTNATFRVDLYFPPSKIDSGREDVRASMPNEVLNFRGSIKGPNLVPQTLILVRKRMLPHGCIGKMKCNMVGGFDRECSTLCLNPVELIPCPCVPKLNPHDIISCGSMER